VQPEVLKEVAHVALSVAETTDVALPVEDEAEETEVADAEEENKITLSDNIHIPIRKLDNLLNLVGELLIERDRMIAVSGEQGRTRSNEFARLQRITSELQYSVMDVRLVQVDVLFNKFHRIVRDVAALEGKQVDLILEGTQNEIDRTILQIISDSLIHLVRNAISHGIETPEKRQQAGKPAAGTVNCRPAAKKTPCSSTFRRRQRHRRGRDPPEGRRKRAHQGRSGRPAGRRRRHCPDLRTRLFECRNRNRRVGPGRGHGRGPAFPRLHRRPHRGTLHGGPGHDHEPAAALVDGRKRRPAV
jgi:hypothetical protein